ncbi:Uncharacterised protein [Bacillus licheniformis]|nr:Uncharacterised protein [Bacillus licheniformis]
MNIFIFSGKIKPVFKIGHFEKTGFFLISKKNKQEFSFG